jgi:hypothetical protein
VTSWPRASRCQAVLMPMMPAPKTITFMPCFHVLVSWPDFHARQAL